MPDEAAVQRAVKGLNDRTFKTLREAGLKTRQSISTIHRRRRGNRPRNLAGLKLEHHESDIVRLVEKLALSRPISNIDIHRIALTYGSVSLSWVSGFLDRHRDLERYMASSRRGKTGKKDCAMNKVKKTRQTAKSSPSVKHLSNVQGTEF